MPSAVRALLAVVAFLSTLSLAKAQAAPPRAPSPSVADRFARAHRPVSTDNAQAQEAFDDGLTLLYAFNPQEARRSFTRALAADPNLAIASWGIALSYGININTPYDATSQRAGHEAILQAQAHEAHASGVERALIAAAVQRYAHFGKNDADASARAYRDAMASVALTYPEDDDVVTLAAEAAMDTDPWGYWTDDGKPVPGTLDIIRALQNVLARNPSHIGANHYLIHAVEASPHPEQALEAARRLAADLFEPAAEHLAHMPAHTFMRVGEYDAAAQADVRALDDFHTYLSHAHAAGHETYYGHDCLFGVDAFMMAGEYQSAKSTALRCENAARRYEGYIAVRFHRWDELSAYAEESPFLTGMAAAAEGRAADALKAAQQLDTAKQDTSAIGAAVVRAKVFAQLGQRDREIAALEHAVQLQDHLGYGEPPAFFYPVRESLGAAQYLAGRYADAERTFRADLARTPKNPRSLFGLSKTLEREGRTSQATVAHRSFATAWRAADVVLDMSTL